MTKTYGFSAPRHTQPNIPYWLKMQGQLLGQLQTYNHCDPYFFKVSKSDYKKILVQLPTRISYGWPHHIVASSHSPLQDSLSPNQCYTSVRMILTHVLDPWNLLELGLFSSQSLGVSWNFTWISPKVPRLSLLTRSSRSSRSSLRPVSMPKLICGCSAMSYGMECFIYCVY